MSKSYLQSITSYLTYLIRSKSKHGIHSPFVFDLVTKVLEDRSRNEDTLPVRNRFQELLNNRNVIETTNFGSGNGRKGYSVQFLKVYEIARGSSVTRSYGELLYRLVKYYRPQTILELGTCLGISTMYMAIAAPDSRIISLEGCAAKASLARNSFEKLGMNHIELSTGRFADTLPLLLEKTPLINFIFIDGHHQYKATMNYFNQILKSTNNETVLVLDDIHWSKSMEAAWAEIGRRPEVTVTIDLYRMGLVFFRKSLSKQNFVIRF